MAGMYIRASHESHASWAKQVVTGGSQGHVGGLLVLHVFQGQRIHDP